MKSSILIALLSIRGIGPKKANALIRSLPVDHETDLASAIESALSPRLSSQQWRSMCIRGEEVVEKTLARGFSVFDIWSTQFPKRLKRLDSCPLVVFVNGEPSALSSQLPLAIVGTRNPCTYARERGAVVAGAAASMASSIISGLAIGCDTIAHMEALSKDVPTVGVVAHGLDTIYPKENERLANQIIASGGCLISEYQPGTPPRPNQFIERDRIQAGLSQSGLLLQSSKSGGSMHAMRALQKMDARIGVLLPPEGADTSEAWGGSVELMSMSDTVVLDASSVSLHSSIKLLMGNTEKRSHDEVFTQTSLF